ncbi:hypothetical protein ACTHP3_07085 [Shouchella rhizosphaerae]|uniref:hypothetical protein n=1 Tax=Shouchella rhizosphaerae TaxID=866786 RepID=UPI003F7DFFFE
MNKTYFIWIGIHFLVWLVAIASMTTHLNEIQLASLCLFFLLLFLLPLFAGKSMMQMTLFLIQILAITVIFYPNGNVFSLFIIRSSVSPRRGCFLLATFKKFDCHWRSNRLYAIDRG